MKGKILVIGAGPNQLPIIKTAKAQGYYVIAVSRKGNYPGFLEADESVYKDIFDVDGIIEYARQAKVGGIISDQSDMAAPIVAKVAEALGLPNWGYETALSFTDKYRMRAVFERLGLPVPKYGHVKDLREAEDLIDEIGYPVVIKPTDSFSSRGVFRIFNQNELHERFAKTMEASRSKNVIVEEYLEGDQYFCQGFVQEHQFRLFAFSDRYYYDLPGVTIPYTNAFPAKISEELQSRMTEMFSRVVSYLDPEFGQVWAEWIYNRKTDKLYIVEMAIRGGGAYVTTDLIPAAYGVDSQPFLVNAAMGNNEKRFADQLIVRRAAAFYSFLLPEGVVRKVEGLENVARIPGVLRTDFKEVKVGDRIPPIEDKGSRYGMVVIEGKDRDEVDQVLSCVKKTINIVVETEDGFRDIIWE